MTDRINIESQATGAEPPANEEKLLAGKYKTQEELEKGYLELQKKFSSTRPAENQDPPAGDPPVGDPPAGDPPASTEPPVSDPPAIPEADPSERFSPYIEEYAENGKLSDESYKKLEGQGIPKDMVDAYIAGQEAKAAETRKTVLSEVGGEDAFTKIATWASQTMTQEQIDVYNEKLEGGSVEDAKMALRDLASKYKQANGPDLIEGDTPPSVTVGKFANWNQVTQAMADPRYKTDEAYRQEVAAKLNASNL